jgi:selenocysteine lyase/cysteine desulfurase
MAALPIARLHGDAAAEALSRRLAVEDGIQVPIGGWPVRAARAGDDPEQVLIRISAQRYNEPADYERLAEALARHLGRG